MQTVTYTSGLHPWSGVDIPTNEFRDTYIKECVRQFGELISQTLNTPQIPLYQSTASSWNGAWTSGAYTQDGWGVVISAYMSSAAVLNFSLQYVNTQNYNPNSVNCAVDVITQNVPDPAHSGQTIQYRNFTASLTAVGSWQTGIAFYISDQNMNMKFVMPQVFMYPTEIFQNDTAAGTGITETTMLYGYDGSNKAVKMCGTSNASSFDFPDSGAYYQKTVNGQTAFKINRQQVIYYDNQPIAKVPVYSVLGSYVGGNINPKSFVRIDGKVYLTTAITSSSTYSTLCVEYK